MIGNIYVGVVIINKNNLCNDEIVMIHLILKTIGLNVYK
jgi:hypothetical protein